MPDGDGPDRPGEMPRVWTKADGTLPGSSLHAAALPDAEGGRGVAPAAAGIVREEVAALRAESDLLREENAFLWTEVVRLRELAQQPWWDPQRVTTSGTHAAGWTASSAARCFTCGASSAVNPHSCGKSSL